MVVLMVLTNNIVTFELNNKKVAFSVSGDIYSLTCIL